MRRPSTQPTYNQPVCVGKIADYRLKLSIGSVHTEWVAKNKSVPFSARYVDFGKGCIVTKGKYYDVLGVRANAKAVRSLK